jgi:general secretion pathway protein H
MAHRMVLHLMNGFRRPSVAGAEPARARRQAPILISDRAGGFSLLEMVVVLVILGLGLGVLAGFVARPNVTVELASATSRIVGAMRLGRALAMTEGQPIRIAVDPDGHGIRVDRVELRLGPRVWVSTSTGGAILFGPNGGAAAPVLQVRVAYREYLVQVDPLTGRIMFSISE